MLEQSAATDETSPYIKPTKDELRRKLTPIQYDVTQNEGTEPAFRNKYWNNKADGTYRCIVCDQALFTNNTWHATDALDLTLGLRYTIEDKELDSRYTNPNGGLGCGAMLANPAQVVAALVARGLTVAQATAAAPQVAASKGAIVVCDDDDISRSKLRKF